MRMMSAEWLASGTDLVRLSAKGLEDTLRQLQREEEGETESESAENHSVTKFFLLPCTS